mmetsp:Transcript_9996/g.16940  ORF Transcript_9996/g.16940 Transcript_9996/m.16940 type:complete len:250 (+) Transcript_9996:95-844(+)
MEGGVSNRALQQKLHVFAKNFLRTNQFDCVTRDLSKSIGGDKEKLSLQELGMVKRQYSAGIDWLISQEKELKQLIEDVSSKMAAPKEPPAKKARNSSKPKVEKVAKGATKKKVPKDTTNRKLQKGDKVAARVIFKGEWQWILGSIVKYHSQEDNWEVSDADDQEQAAHYLKRPNILRLCDGKGTYNVGTKVLAMYPDTTVFYKGTVSQPSVSYEGRQYCLIQFEGDEDKATGALPHRTVEACFVARYPE